MMLRARIGLGRQVIDMESQDGGSLALPLADIMRQLADGRRHGEFEVTGTRVRYADVTDVEMTWKR